MSIITGEPTSWWLSGVDHRLQGGAGQGVRLLGGGRLGDLLLEGLGQAALQELSARPELLVVLGVL